MIVLDENVIQGQRETLLAHRLAVRQIGVELGKKGTDDRAILALLMRLSRPTFFTRDDDFYDPRLCHSRYCLVRLEIDETAVARFVRRVLSHPELDTSAKRMGKIIRASESGLAFWTANAPVERHLTWMRLRR